MRWLSRLVTFSVIAAVAVVLALVIRARMPETSVGGDFRAWALFRDASRISVGSPVMIAGVRVGQVDKLTIEGAFARVDLRLRSDTNIPVDSWITKRAVSAFGDSYLEIIPSSGEEGAPPARPLRSGEQIIHVDEGTSTDTVLRAIARTMPKIDRGLEVVHDFMLSAREWTDGPLQDRIKDIDRWLGEGHVESPLDSAARAMERAETATASAADAVAGAAPDVDGALTRFSANVISARRKMTDLRSGLTEGLADARTGMDRIDPTVQQLADVMTAVNQGTSDDFKGKLGRQINDPSFADTLEDVSDAGREAVANFNRLSYLGLRAEYDVFSRSARIYATAEIHARNDKFYLIEFEKGALGGVPIDELRDAPNVTPFTRAQEIQDEIRFTAQFGKRLGRWRFRGGIKDSEPGIGADLLLLDGGALKLSADVFGGYDKVPRLKLAAAYEVVRSLYIIGGIDDALNSPHYLDIITGNTNIPTFFDRVRIGRDYFVGGIASFTDEDLATLIRVYGAMLAGLL